MLEGYIAIQVHGHPYASKNYVFEHRIVAERALGRLLPRTAVIHHINEIKTDNTPRNLVILESLSEHMALHMRLRILRAGGNPWTQHICSVCGPKDKSEFRVKRERGFRPSGKCISCCNARDRARHQRLKTVRADDLAISIGQLDPSEVPF